MKWEICICTFGGDNPPTSMPTGWYETMFGDREGIDAYFRQMSGGREDIDLRVF